MATPQNPTMLDYQISSEMEEWVSDFSRFLKEDIVRMGRQIVASDIPSSGAKEICAGDFHKERDINRNLQVTPNMFIMCGV